MDRKRRPKLHSEPNFIQNCQDLGHGHRTSVLVCVHTATAAATITAPAAVALLVPSLSAVDRNLASLSTRQF